ncbi:hypothetical protein [Piscinibacter koreensis]|uniref:Uncharacterized protein n=1 Tax=Piscinibacter koreensis TaxID=2742824 RepID=A0A7Y6TXY4_9BURK|nr:hypothetical protein [Schlegelella koreensis]NUZ07653.1 hypothetical protein [Schlegelella koreensis]
MAAIPSKYRVKAADGSVDRDASMAKLAEGYRALESRMGSASGRPAAPDDYVIDVPEELAGAFDPAAPEFKAFQAEAHEMGFSQKQLDFVMGKYFQEAPRLVAGAQAADAHAAEATLRSVWPTEGAFDTNLQNAERAVAQFGADLGESVVRDLQNKPAVIQLLARIGAQLREDAPPQGDLGSRGNPGINELLAHPAYSNPRHPEHDAISARVNAYYASQPDASKPI